jgi:hypothetical protein
LASRARFERFETLDREAIGMRWLVVALITVSALALCAGCSSVAERLDWIGPDREADWIRLDRPAQLGIFVEPQVNYFKRGFDIDGEVGARLHLRAMRQVAVYLDGRLIFQTDPGQVGWIAERIVDLGPYLTRGEHTLWITVRNPHGPTLLLAHAPALDIATGRSWLASPDGESWSAAALASDPLVAPISQRFQRADRATLAILPALLSVVALGWLGLRSSRLPRFAPARRWLGADPARRIHTLLLLCVGALMLNNLFRLPRNLGFDIQGHYDYIHFILEHARIPLATDGWQMFQSPLYYLVAVPIYRLAGAFFEPPIVEVLMRVISVASGLWLIDLCFRALRCAFPARPDLQVAGSAFAALLPANLSLTHYIGNEPMAACLTAASLLAVFRALSSPPVARNPRFQWLLGGTLGLALLAKVTPVLALGPVAIAIAWALSRAGADLAQTGAAAGRVAFAVLAVSGWYYGRNWLLLGSPFVGGWSDDRGIDWWQDPGYQQIGDYVRFGRALFYPFYASLAGFWDGLYSTFWLDGQLGSMVDYEARPPWNYTFMLSLAWLSLPFGGIMLLSARSLRNPILWFSWCCVGSYLLAMLVLHLLVPHYSPLKATYMLGLLPCLCVLFAAGLERLSAPWRRTAICWLATWAVASYAAFFVIA